jgi:8-oxo-dGTP pyrophosphatase MutT (NUDIX family)
MADTHPGCQPHSRELASATVTWPARFAYQMLRLTWRVRRPLTLGVKGMLVSGDDIVLVRHTYQRSWLLPGGKIRRGETPEAALRRELDEELGATLGSVELLCVCSQFLYGKSDHITVFVCRSFTLGKKRDLEIESCELFPMRDLPADTSRGTRRRVRELLDGTPCSSRNW